MPLLTVEDVQDEATLPERNVDLTDYTDNQLEKKIASAQAYIEEYTGRVFDETIITGEQHFTIVKNRIQLNKSPVISVERVMINDSEYTGSFILNKQLGIINLDTNYNSYNQFDVGYADDFYAEIDYTISENTNSNTYIRASDICMDLFFINLNKSSDGQNIKSVKDSNFSVTYEQDDPIDNINKELDKLKKISIRSC